MKVSFNQIKEVVDTLPIGFYVDRRVPVTLEKFKQDSVYDGENDTIKISFPTIHDALLEVEEGVMEVEKLVRGLCYHEVSHALLTDIPKMKDSIQSVTSVIMEDHKQDWILCSYSEEKLKRQNLQKSLTTLMNIAEDARIEALLDGYFYDTNFEETKKCIIGDYTSVPADASEIEKIFLAFRYGIGEKALVEKTKAIINGFAYLTPNSSWVDWDSYIRVVASLLTNQDEDEASNSPYQMPSASDLKDGGEPTEEENKQSSNSKGNKKAEENPASKETKESVEEDQSDIGKSVGKGILKKQLSTVLHQNENIRFYTSIKRILEAFNKKNAGGCAMLGYSGVLNVRNADRKDCRFFDRPATKNGSNQFGCVTITLWIDVSGSFKKNKKAVNSMLSQLKALEKEYSTIFSFNIIHCGEGEELRNKSNCFIDPNTNNDWSVNEAKELMKRTEKKNSYNYHIVLFDGDCFPSTSEDEEQCFRMFNNHHTTIISDEDNEERIDRTAPSCRKIICRDGKYAEMLQDNVISAIQKGFQ